MSLNELALVLTQTLGRELTDDELIELLELYDELEIEGTCNGSKTF